MFNFDNNKFPNVYLKNTEFPNLNKNPVHFKPYNKIEFVDLTHSMTENFVPGFNPDNSCNNIDPSNVNMINKCVDDLKSNYSAISAYSSLYKSLNTDINQNYMNIQNSINDVSNTYIGVNDPTANDVYGAAQILNKYNNYDYIDYSGNIINSKEKNNSIQKQFLNDTVQKINYYDSIFIVSSISLITIAIVAVAVVNRK
jgi:hypothetical protein